MPRALIDTTVLYAAAYRRDAAHEEGLAILRGVDTADLPEAVVLDYVLAETLNGLTTHAGHEAAVDFLDRIEANARFHIESLTADGRAMAKAQFRQYEVFSFVDACLSAYLKAEELDYLYAFDDDFDTAAHISRLETATNPYQPE
ncbi:PIN domain-containing protein [Halonotius terrestris]|uniref:PIN domain-containing protein n=1 Tax=Halonotius terrestris TaxID=2487750 RepID=A0A8J8TDB6_9EURY|nr:PIN domain-containing protein [Halonotius terrestris]TQQ82906.1 PIN domain-containing protein [Halonotius terrestris]